MALVWNPPPIETVDSWEVRIGKEWIKHNFGRQVPIQHAVEMARNHLATYEPEPKPQAGERG